MRPDVLAESLAATIRGLLGPIGLRLAALEARVAPAAALEQLAARLAVLETREPVPGPPGPPGPAGRDGVDGKNFEPDHTGRYVEGKTYDVGQFALQDGSTFRCKRLTTSKPGTSGDWEMWAMRGDRGRPGKDSGSS